MIPKQFVKSTRQGFRFALLVAIACGSVGCGLPVQWQKMASKLPEATPGDPVNHILCIWKPSEGHDPDGNHTRGFAGQICFFTRRHETPVRVNGTVTITVYDDQGKPEERGKPLHNWEFVGDAWKIHLHDGTLGPTYSVFIPYSRKGNHQAQCALRVCLEPENGRPIYSDTSAVILPGLYRKKAQKAEDEKPEKETRTSLKSLTIPLKEKQKQRFSELHIGESKMERVVAPASELARRAALHGGNFGTQNASAGPNVNSTNSPALESLPSPPPQTLPRAVMPAKPIQEATSNPSDAFHRTREIGFRSRATTETSPNAPANSFQGNQPAQPNPSAQPTMTPGPANAGHPLGDLGGATQSFQSGP